MTSSREEFAHAGGNSRNRLSREPVELHELVDALPMFLSIIDREQRYLFASAAYRGRLNIEPAEMIGKTIEEVLGSEEYTKIETYIEAALRGERVRYEADHGTAPPMITEAEYIPRIDSRGNPDGFFAVVRNVSDQRRHENALAESEGRLRLALDAGRMALWQVNIATQELTATPELGRIFGIPVHEEVTLERARSYYKPGELQRLRLVAAEAVENKKRYAETDLEIVRPDGIERTLALRAEILVNGSGEPTQVVGVVIDVTEARLAKDCLISNEALMTGILNSALDAIIVIDQNSRIVEWNAAAEKMFSIPKDRAVGGDIAELIIPAEHRVSHRKGMLRLLKTGVSTVLGRRVEVVAQREGGELFPVELAISPVSVAKGLYFTAYLRDLTVQKRSEAALRWSEQRLKATYEHAFVGIGEVDPTGKFVRVNEQMCRITGYSREELQRLTFLEITHPEDRSEDAALFAEQMVGRCPTYSLQKRYLNKRGDTVWVEVMASFVGVADRTPEYGIRVVRDVSEKHAAEERRQILVNELNHRVKNTLATVQSLVAVTLRSTSKDQIEVAINARIATLSAAHNVLTEENWSGAGLSDIVAAALAPFGLGDRIKASGPDVYLHPGKALSLSLVLHELATNAAKYGSLAVSGGSIELSWTSSERSDSAWLDIEWSEANGPVVEAPSRKGFGTRLIERLVEHDLGGTIHTEFRSGGICCAIRCPSP